MVMVVAGVEHLLIISMALCIGFSGPVTAGEQGRQACVATRRFATKRPHHEIIHDLDPTQKKHHRTAGESCSDVGLRGGGCST